jgi:hypothetical protein
MEELQRIIDGMDPKKAIAEMARALRKLFPLLDEEERTDFVIDLIGESGGDKLSSMVHL